jgi:predicted nucleic acid-binding protein
MGGAYLDTGVLIKLYIFEPGSGFVQKRVRQNGPLLLNRLQETELRNGVLASAGRGLISSSALGKTLAHFAEDREAGRFSWEELVWESLWDRAQQLAERFTPRFLCRTLDILHVAAAEQSGAEVFFTGDARQERLARAVGLRVLKLPQASPTKRAGS